MNTPKPNISKLFALLVFLFSVQISFAQKPYCLFDSEKGVLTLGYGTDLPEGAEEINADGGYPGILQGTSVSKSDVLAISFSSSFDNFTPKSCYQWFRDFSNVTHIDGLQFLHTSDVSSFGSMFCGCEKLKSIDLSGFDTQKVTDMDAMFENCYSLESLDLSSFNTSLVNRMRAMFRNCLSLRYIIVSSGWTTAAITSEEMSKGIFSHCDQLFGGKGTHCESSDVTYARIDKGTSQPGYLTSKDDTPYLGPVPYAIYEQNTHTITFGCGKTIPENGIIIAPGQYTRCMAGGVAKNTDIWRIVFDPSFQNFIPTTCEYWFYDCYYLTEIDGLNYLNTQKVTEMDYMFAGCRELQDVDLSGFVTDNVSLMTGMFEGCHHLRSLDLSSFNTANLKDAEYLFENCYRLQTIYVSDKWTRVFAGNDANSAKGMFKDCVSLYGGEGTHFEEDNPKYAHIDGGTANPGYFTEKGKAPFQPDVPYSVYDSKNKALTLAYGKILPEGAHPMYPIDFEGWMHDEDDDPKDVESITIDASFASFKPTTCKNWFSRYEKVKKINGLENINTEELENMNGMFYWCQALKELDLSNFNTTKVTDMYHLFCWCTSLQYIYVSEDKWNTEAVTSCEGIFYSCYKLYGGKGTHCTVSEANNIAMAHIDGGTENPGFLTKSGEEPFLPEVPCAMFDSETGTLSLYYNNKLPDGATEIQPDDIYSASYLFGTYIGQKLTDPKNVKKIVFDKSFANYKPTSCQKWFYGCENLTEIEGLNYVSTSEVEDMYSMFDGCSSLTSLDLSSFNTSKVKKMSDMFFNCQALKCIYVSPDKWNTEAVTSSNLMFANCYNLYGGKGTPYIYSGDEIKYARIDGGADNPGYLTKAGEEPFIPTLPYVAFNSETGTLTLGYAKNLPEGAKEIRVSDYVGSEVAEHDQIKKVVFDKSFANYYPTSCKSWFWSCTNLTEIEGLEYLKTDKVTDMSSMFSGCGSLTTLDVSNFNTENVTDMSGMFWGCSSLTTIDVSSFNTESVTDMHHLFSHCERLTTVDVSSFETKNVTDMNNMFSGCSSLTHLDLKGFNTENVTTMWAMFESCWNLESLDLSNFNTENVTTMSAMFYCSGVKSLNLSGFNTAKVTDMNNMFIGCRGLTTIDISDFNTENVLDMGWMFCECSSLESIIVGDKWSTASVKSSKSMFDKCTKLYGSKGSSPEELNVYDATYARIDGGADQPGYFSGVNDEPYIPYSAYAKFDSQTGTLTVGYGLKNSFPEGSALIDPNDISVGSYIGSELTEAKNVKKIVIDKSFAEFNPYRCQRWFNFCSNVADIEGIDNIHTENVEDMGEMFCLCSSLVTLDLSSFDTKKVKNMNAMFNGCTSLKTIYVSDKWSVGSVTDCADMFSPDKKLYGGKGTPYTVSDIKYARIDGGADNPGYFTKSGDKPFEPSLTYGIFNSQTGILILGYSKTLPDGATEINAEKTTSEQWIASEITDAANVKKIIIDKSFADFQPTLCSYWFYKCSNLAEIEGIEYISTANVTDMRRMFYMNQALPALDLRTFNTAKVKDMYEMFFSCDELKTVVVSDKWTTENVDVSSAMFRFCDNLVGGKGTKFDEDKALDKTFAKLDGGADNPGYFSENFPVVIEVLPIAIEIKVSPKTEYTEGDALSTENGVLTIKYSDNTTQTVDLSQAEITGFDSDKVGEQTLTVKYLGFTTELVVNVKAKSNGNPEDNPGTPVSGNPSADNIKIWSFGHTVFVENAQKEIQVVNTLGKTILIQSPTTDRIELNIQKSGIYIIKTANKTQKVVIQ